MSFPWVQLSGQYALPAHRWIELNRQPGIVMSSLAETPRMLPDFSSADVHYWPLLLGWSVVSLLYIFGWKRQALIATAGMAIVTYAVISVGLSSS